SMNSGSHNGRILSLGANAPRLEMTQDASKGMLTFYVVEEKSETFATPVSFSEAPVLEVTTASGPKSFTLTRVEGQPNAWSATDPMLRSADVRGTIRVKIADKSYDARIDADQAKAGSMSRPAPAASDTDP